MSRIFTRVMERRKWGLRKVIWWRGGIGKKRGGLVEGSQKGGSQGISQKEAFLDASKAFFSN